MSKSRGLGEDLTMTTPSLKGLVKPAAALPVPQDYFRGVRAVAPVRADNVLMFHRESFSTLQQRALENRSHHRFVLFVVLDGGAGVNLDRIEHPLREGMALLAFPYQFHVFLHPERESLSWLILTFESDSPEVFAPMRDRPVPVDAVSARRLGDLLSAYGAAKPGAEAEVRLLAELFLQGLVDSAKILESAPVPAETAPGAVREAARWLTYINGKLHAGGAEVFRIPTLARELGVSERLLRLRFREHFGVSLGAYIHDFQLNRAAGLLTQSAVPLGEIAGRCGYVSASAFSRAFRERTGVSPRDYRRTRRESGS